MHAHALTSKTQQKSLKEKDKKHGCWARRSCYFGYKDGIFVFFSIITCMSRQFSYNIYSFPSMLDPNDSASKGGSRGRVNWKGNERGRGRGRGAGRARGRTGNECVGRVDDLVISFYFSYNIFSRILKIFMS